MRRINNTRAVLIPALFVLCLFSGAYGSVKNEPALSIGFSSGVYQINYAHVSVSERVSGTAVAPEPALGVLALLTVPVPLIQDHMPFGLCAQAGYNYNLPANNLSVSYSFANILLSRDMSIDMLGFIGAGAVYSIWNQGIDGGLGWQAVAGTKNDEGLYAGFRYISVPGSRLTGAYKSTFLLSQVVFDLQYSF